MSLSCLRVCILCFFQAISPIFLLLLIFLQSHIELNTTSTDGILQRVLRSDLFGSAEVTRQMVPTNHHLIRIFSMVLSQNHGYLLSGCVHLTNSN